MNLEKVFTYVNISIVVVLSIFFLLGIFKIFTYSQLRPFIVGFTILFSAAYIYLLVQSSKRR